MTIAFLAACSMYPIDQACRADDPQPPAPNAIGGLQIIAAPVATAKCCPENCAKDCENCEHNRQIRLELSVDGNVTGIPLIGKIPYMTKLFQATKAEGCCLETCEPATPTCSKPENQPTNVTWEFIPPSPSSIHPFSVIAWQACAGEANTANHSTCEASRCSSCPGSSCLSAGCPGTTHDEGKVAHAVVTAHARPAAVDAGHQQWIERMIELERVNARLEATLEAHATLDELRQEMLQAQGEMIEQMAQAQVEKAQLEAKLEYTTAWAKGYAENLRLKNELESRHTSVAAHSTTVESDSANWIASVEKLRAENEALHARITELEKQLREIRTAAFAKPDLAR
jgi:hypothetical protein